MREKILLIFLGLVLVFSLVSASFETGFLSYSIEKQYTSYDNIKGWINISFNSEPGDSLFEDSFGNSLSLLDLLKTNSGISYTCSTGSLCLPNYEVNNPEQTKTFSLNSGEKKIIGFQITENIVDVNSITFNVESDAIASCTNQLEIDFLRDGNVDFSNNKTSTSYCLSKNYGCFDTSKSLSNAPIDSKSYCQKITLSESPGFNVGAWIKEGTAGNKKLSMKLYNMNRNYLASCELPAASSSGGEIGCDLNYSNVKTEEYYVCVSSIGSVGEYYTRGYSDSSGGCGYHGYPTTPLPENYAYQIFVRGKKFSAIETLEISNILPNGNTLSEIVNDYIEMRYGGGCSSGCIIPIEFISKVNQNLVLKNLSANYKAGGGLENFANEFYDLSEIPPIINSELQIINLDEGNFSVPSDYGEETFELSLDGEEIFSEDIIIKSAPLIKDLRPKITAAAVPTEFEVLIDSLNITKYEWGFGDGTNVTTVVNKVTHAYNSTGMYELKIIITDNNQLISSKTFKINVSSPEQAINTTLKKKLDDLSKISLQMKQSKFEKNLKSVLNFDALESQLNKIQQDYRKASSENDFKIIIISLLGIKVPESIGAVKNAESISFYPKKNNINLDVIKEIGGGDYDTQYRDGYVDALIFWNQENIDTKVTFSEFSVSYGYFDEEPILRTFEFQINKKNSLDDSYLIIDKLEGIGFEEDYFMKEEAGYLYMELEQDSETIRFTTTADVNFVDVPVFISPKLEKLKIAESFEPNEDENGSKWIFFIFVLFFLILVGVGVYIILQEWYKKRYERYLFKRENDLYNLMIYITQEKKKGLSNKEIYAKLRKSGWSSEQANYVLKKHSGKRTGMFEIISFKKKKIQQKPNSVNKK